MSESNNMDGGESIAPPTSKALPTLPSSRRAIVISVSVFIVLGVGVAFSLILGQEDSLDTSDSSMRPIPIGNLIDAQNSPEATLNQTGAQDVPQPELSDPDQVVLESGVLLADLQVSMSGLSDELGRITSTNLERHELALTWQASLLKRLTSIEEAMQAQRLALIALDKEIASQRRRNTEEVKALPPLPRLLSVLRISGLLSARFQPMDGGGPSDVFVGDQVGSWSVKDINFDSQQVTLRSGKTERIVSLEHQ